MLLEVFSPVAAVVQESDVGDGDGLEVDLVGVHEGADDEGGAGEGHRGVGTGKFRDVFFNGQKRQNVCTTQFKIGYDEFIENVNQGMKYYVL